MSEFVWPCSKVYSFSTETKKAKVVRKCAAKNAPLGYLDVLRTQTQHKVLLNSIRSIDH